MSKFQDPLEPEQPFKIPSKFWNQLTEFTGGGFICFYVDNFGQMQVEANFDSEMAEEAIRAWGGRFLNSMSAAAEISETQEFLGMNDPDKDNENEE